MITKILQKRSKIFAVFFSDPACGTGGMLYQDHPGASFLLSLHMPDMARGLLVIEIELVVPDPPFWHSDRYLLWRATKKPIPSPIFAADQRGDLSKPVNGTSAHGLRCRLHEAIKPINAVMLNERKLLGKIILYPYCNLLRNKLYLQHDCEF
jgi:hypothetical protein